MKHCLLFLIFCILGLVVVSQELDWKTAKNWRLFDLRGRSAISAKVDSLGSVRNVLLDSSEMKSFLSGATRWPEQKSAVWMGSYLVTCVLPDNKTRKLLISTYAGFFYDELTHRYYQIPTEMVEDWQDYFNDKSKTLIAGK